MYFLKAKQNMLKYIEKCDDTKVVVIVWWLDLRLPVQSVHITTIVVSLNIAHADVYSIQYYVIIFVSDLW
jgi:hypothetical protein